MTKNIKELKRPIDQNLLELVNLLKQGVENGKITGITSIVTLVGNEHNFWCAGNQNYPEVAAAMDAWKFDQLLRARTEQDERKR